jgi:myo-inositol-1(or 4)-monophosphatase
VYHELVSLCEESARLGGRILQQWRSRFTAREKSPANLVTEADEASQKAIFELIERRIPGCRFLGEEGLLIDDRSSPLRWVIDPLDGTSNYVHGFPYYAVSVGVEKDGKLVAGAVYDPTRDEMFIAHRGSGALLNGTRLRVSPTTEISHAMCMASLPVKANRYNEAVERFLRALDVAQSVQRSGSAALNLCCVASGRIDVFWSSSLKAWDMAAGVLLVEEAGGQVTKIDGSPFILDEPEVLATNGTTLHQQSIAMLLNKPA